MNFSCLIPILFLYKDKILNNMKYLYWYNTDNTVRCLPSTPQEINEYTKNQTYFDNEYISTWYIPAKENTGPSDSLYKYNKTFFGCMDNVIIEGRVGKPIDYYPIVDAKLLTDDTLNKLIDGEIIKLFC